MKSKIVNLEEDADGNMLLTIPQDILDELGWTEGTELDVTEKDGLIHLTEVKKKKKKKKK